MTKGFLARFTILALAASLVPIYGQVAAGLSPVPIYPQSGQIPDVLKDKYVFLDPPANQIVVSYPDPQNPGQRRVLRFDRHNQVDLIVTSSVAAQPNGLYHYEYIVQNGVNGQKSVKQWSLSLGNSSDDKLAATHPAWQVTKAPSSVSRPGAIRPEIAVTWTGPVGVSLGKAQALGKFQLVSALKPGLAIGYATAEVSAEYSAVVASIYLQK